MHVRAGNIPPSRPASPRALRGLQGSGRWGRCSAVGAVAVSMHGDLHACLWIGGHLVGLRQGASVLHCVMDAGRLSLVRMWQRVLSGVRWVTGSGAVLRLSFLSGKGSGWGLCGGQAAKVES